MAKLVELRKASNVEIWTLVKHFKQSEFDSRDLKGTGANMQPDFLLILESLRRLIGKPMRINSGFRTEAHNKAEGGAPKSAHLIGRAADIGTTGWTKQERRDLILYARKLGVIGIGVGKTFIHLDDMPRNGKLAAWVYRGGTTVAIPVAIETQYV